MNTFTEVDHARFLLNFDRMELGVSRTGAWKLFYRAPCRFLHSAEGACRLHDSPAQPRICRHYNPYNCWYRRMLTRDSSHEYLRVDRQRLEILLPLLAFDGDGRLVDVPDWPALAGAFRDLPLAEWPPAGGDSPAEDPLDRAWREQVQREGNPPPEEAPSLAYTDLADPCAGCGAPCCRALMFPGGVPATASNLDFFQFILGFPDLTLGVADGGWYTIVRSTCRHFADGRCTVFGLPQRPKVCAYQDAWNCTPRLRLGTPRPPGFLRVSPDLFPWLVELLRFDREGRVVRIPPVRELRAHFEDRLRKAGRGEGNGGTGPGGKQLSIGNADKG